jgi:hypothetical protein
MFKFEWPWTRKKRLAEEARAAEARRLDEKRTRIALERLRAERGSNVNPRLCSAAWHTPEATRISPSTIAERRYRERQEQERLRRDREEETRRNQSNDGDFLTSMVVAQATNSTLMGYAVGGNLAGAMVGDALTPDTDQKREETWHGSGGEASGAGASASWEPREETRAPDPDPEPSRYESSSSSYESSSSSYDSGSSSSDSGSSSSSSD